jgi:hypothetical protein
MDDIILAKKSPLHNRLKNHFSDLPIFFFSSGTKQIETLFRVLPLSSPELRDLVSG